LTTEDEKFAGREKAPETLRQPLAQDLAKALKDRVAEVAVHRKA
jgi:hypothetical protein